MTNNEIKAEVTAKENEGRTMAKKILQIFGGKYFADFSNDCGVDLFYINNQNKPSIVEIKKRDIRLDDYPTAILSTKKIKELYKFNKNGFHTEFLFICRNGFTIYNLSARFEQDYKFDIENIETNKTHVNPAAGKHIDKVVHLQHDHKFRDIKCTTAEAREIMSKNNIKIKV